MLLLTEYVNIYSSPNQSKQIMYFLKKFTNRKDIITDATAGIGGNAIYFSKYYSFVFCIEKLTDCIGYLESNLKIFNNILIINDNCLDILKIIKSDVIFFDPPWGGKNYKTKQSINLYLNDIPINIIIDNLFKYCKVIALKAPNNYKIKYSEYWKIKTYSIFKEKNKVVFKLLIYHK